MPLNILGLGLTMYIMEHVKKINSFERNFEFFHFNFIKSIILYFQSEMDMTIFTINVVAITCSLIWPSFFCYFSNLTTDNVLRLGNTVYDLSWFDHPIAMQKYIILMIARSHERIDFSGLGLIPCSLEAFGKVWFFCFHYHRFQWKLVKKSLFTFCLSNYLNFSITAFEISMFILCDL